MEFTKLKIDQYRVNSREIIEKISVVLLNSERIGQTVAVPVTINLNNLPSALIKFIKQLGYMDENLSNIYKKQFNLLSLGSIEYKEERKSIYYSFINDIRNLFSTLTELGTSYRYPAANTYQYLIKVSSESEEKLIRSKKFISELEKIFLNFLDKLDLMYAVPLFSKKMSLIKNENTYFNLRVDFLADKFIIKLSIEKDYFNEDSILILQKRLDFLEKEVNKIYSKASLESNFRYLNEFEIMEFFTGIKSNGYGVRGFSRGLEIAVIDFMRSKHKFFENKCDLELVSFSIDHEKSIAIQVVSEEYYNRAEKFILGYGNFTSKDIVNLAKNLENLNFIHGTNMNYDFARLMSISTPH